MMTDRRRVRGFVNRHARPGSMGIAAGNVLTIAVLSIWLLVGCGSGESSTSRSKQVFSLPSAPLLRDIDGPLGRGGPRHLRSVPWTVSGVPHGNRLPIASQVGFCVSGRPPALWGVHIVEGRGRVDIAAYVKVTPPPPTSDCRGVGGIQRGIVELGREVRGARIYDVTPSPPRLRWPVASAKR